MFEECTTLGELNAARIQAASKGGSLIDINNAYNKRRQGILSARNTFKKLQATYIQPRSVTYVSGVPIAGRCPIPNTIQLTAKGFLY